MRTKHWPSVTVVALAFGLCATARAGAQAPVAPTLRHAGYLAIEAPRGAQVRCQAACVAHGYRSYQDWLRWRLVRPDGFVAAAGRIRPGEKGDIAFKTDWGGRCVLEANSGWNLSQLQFPADIPHAYVSRLSNPLKTVRAWGPLHFYVPKDTRYFNIWIHASVRGEGLHYTLRDPLGKVVREEDGDFDARAKVQVRVPKGQDAAAWSIAITKPTAKGMALDDVHVELGRHLPPFLAPRPEWAKRFAGDWRYDPKAPEPKRRFADAQPTLEPFRGVAGPEIDQAYSRDTAKRWKTSLPFTYVLDYGSKHLGHPEYVPTVATAPPTLLHLGKDVPFNHGWGPVKALGGENQAHGRGDDIARLSPEQVRERIEGLRKMVAALHKSGVRWVTPYICGMTVNGDPERRTGFWGFYDHWNDYRPLGLAARPPADPVRWLQRHPDGKRRIYYGYDFTKGYYPPFRTNHRCAACWRTDGWRTWLSEVVRFAARCGHDGVFVDNANSQRCMCTRCLAAFREFLGKRFTPERARRFFGDVSPDKITFPTEREQRSTPLYAEMQRYWCETVREELAELKDVGTAELGREFIIFPNGGRPTFIQRALMDTDFVMFEKSHGEYGTHPGLVLSPVIEGVKLRAYNDNIFEHKFVQCLRRRVRPIILSRAGWPSRPPWRMMNPNAARLGMAECGAFSGGGGFLLRPYFGVYHDALNEYRRFFETHPSLYAGFDSYAQVAVLACPEQSWLGNAAHLASVRVLTRALTKAHVLFDYVSEARLTEAVLRRYTTVVAAELRVVPDGQLLALTRYVEKGGRLLLAGDFATLDDAKAERKPAAAERAALLAVPEGTQRAWGRGIVRRCPTVETVPGVLGTAASVLSCPDAQVGPHVKVNAFRTVREAPGRLVVHVVNYNVPLGIDADPPTPVAGIELSIPLPEGTQAALARVHAPEEARPAPVAVRTANGRARLRLPTLRIYRVVELTLTR